MCFNKTLYRAILPQIIVEVKKIPHHKDVGFKPITFVLSSYIRPLSLFSGRLDSKLLKMPDILYILFDGTV